MELVYPPVLVFARGVFAAQGLRFRMAGTQHIPRTGGAVLAINHTGYLDFAYAGYAALKARRLVRFMAKEAVFRHPVSGPLMRGMKHIPVDRAAGAVSYAEAVEALRRGEIVGVFPEATISESFELKDFKSGAARMAAEAGVPIVPLAIWGSQRVWTKGMPKRLGRTRVPILMEAGAPVRVEASEDPAQVMERVKAELSRLLDGLQAAYPTLTGPELRFLPARLGGTAPTPEQVAARHA